MNLLAYHEAEGHILRVRRGLYATPRGATDPYLLASKVAPEAVIAYHAALQYRGCAYSVWHRYPVLTRRRTLPVQFQDMEFIPVHAPPRLRERADLGGFTTAEPRGPNAVVRVTSHERTIVDVLDAPHLGGSWEEIWRSIDMISFVDVEAVIEYTLLLGVALTTARVGYLLDVHRERWMITEEHLVRLGRHVPRRPQYFDPTRRGGSLAPRWNLYVPAEIVNQEWEEEQLR